MPELTDIINRTSKFTLRPDLSEYKRSDIIYNYKKRICIDSFDKIPMHSSYYKTPRSNTAAGGAF
ncbi:MAG: hypothetical protein ACT6FF_00955 [Methanosarcinaceae archaeon]